MADDRDIWQQLMYFDAEEFGDGAEKMEPELLRRLDRMRALAGIPIVITDAWRDVKPGEPPEHENGYAVDVRCKDSKTRLTLVRAAIDAGFKRIGVYTGHLHVGCDPTLPQLVMWIGVSR